MFSGLELTNNSGRFFGTHQKIDRVAYRVLSNAVNLKHFPSKKQILQFEGRNGPDGIKIKSPAQDEPWHYIDPANPNDTDLITLILQHLDRLSFEISKSNLERAGFEASWLAHAIVDGLTPAHHYPYEEKLVELRKGESIESRTSPKEKLLMKGDTKSELVKNNWQMWGFKGLFISHVGFEWGVTAISSPFIFRQVKLDHNLVELVNKIGFEKYYISKLRTIAKWNMYDEYTRFGWTWSISKQVRDELMPLIIETVAVSWYVALRSCGYASRLKNENN